jgi:hypothetical protein
MATKFALFSSKKISIINSKQITQTAYTLKILYLKSAITEILGSVATLPAPMAGPLTP